MVVVEPPGEFITRTPRSVDVVDTDARASDDLQAGRARYQFSIDPCRAADDNAVHLGDGFEQILARELRVDDRLDGMGHLQDFHAGLIDPIDQKNFKIRHLRQLWSVLAKAGL